MALLLRRASVAALSVAILAGLAAPTRAVTLLPPIIEIQVTGTSLPLGEMSTVVPLVQVGEVWQLLGDSWHWAAGNGAFELAMCSSLGADPLCSDPTGVHTEFDPSPGTVLDPDPIIKYLFGVQNNGGAPLSFSMTFTQAIVATPAPGIANHHQSSSTTDNDGNGVTVTPNPPPGGVPVDGNNGTEIYVYTLSTNGGVTLLNAGLDLRTGFVGAAGTSDGQAGLEETGPGPAGSGFYDFMRVDVNFDISGNRDIITFNGRAEIVPEPGTALLLGAGLAALAAARRRRG